MRIYIPMKNFNARKDLIASISIALFTWMLDRSIKPLRKIFINYCKKILGKLI